MPDTLSLPQALIRDHPSRRRSWSHPHQPQASSEGLGWNGIEAMRFRAVPGSEIHHPAFSHHVLFLFIKPPETLDWRYEGVKRHSPPPAGAISLLPAGTPAAVRWSGDNDLLHVFLEPALLARAAGEAFDVDPARVTIPPLDAVELPHLRAAMTAVGAELTCGGLGGPLAAQSLANVMAVYLLRHVLSPRQPARPWQERLPRAKLRAVLEYVEEHLDATPTLEQMAAVARLSPTYFASQFKWTMGLPPHQYVIQRRVERAKQLMRVARDASLAEIALDAGFCDQSQLSHHFKRLVGVTPGEFRRGCPELGG
jgi:AraC family transcriptional regulator